MTIRSSPSNESHWLAPSSPDALIEIRPSQEPWILDVTPRLLSWSGLPASMLRQQPWAAIAAPPFQELRPLIEQLCHRQKPIRNYPLSFRDHQGHEKTVLIQAYVFAGTETGALSKIALYMQEESQQQCPCSADEQSASFYGMLGRAEAIQKVFRKIAVYGPTDAPVLITGETGTGKELAAHALHQLSRRKERLFLAVNCAALAEELLESELFGHERGSFTGAVRSHKGRFERAHQGTLFLDEIGEMPLRTQAKLLRVLENGRLERVGGEQEVAVDVRIAAATNVPLDVAVQERTFRADLYHRLAVLRLHMPALRDRQEDIPLLVTHFLHVLNQRYHRQVHGLTPEALALLREYSWPGNIRELRNVLERVYIETPTEVIRLQDFEEWFYEHTQDFANFPASTSYQDASSHPLPSRELLSPVSTPYRALLPASSVPLPPLAIDADPTSFAYLPTAPPQVPTARSSAAMLPLRAHTINRQRLAHAYAQAHGNIRRTAQFLGIHRATLYRWMHALGITRAELDTMLESQPLETVTPSPGLLTKHQDFPKD